MTKFIMQILALAFILSCVQEPKYIKEIIGLSKRDIILKYGEPQRETEFQLTDTLYEYQYGLIDKFPELSRKKIIITELYWTKENQKQIVVWLYKKEDNVEVIDNLVWFDDEIQF